MMGGMMGMPGSGLSKKEEEKLTKLTRTDFLIQFVWQPKSPDEMPKTAEDYKAKFDEELKKLVDAQKGQTEVRIDEASIEKASADESKAVENALTKQAAPAAGASTAPAGAAPGTPGPAGTAPPGAAPPATPK
jgi:type IV pilus assembly protein PilM